MNQPDVRPISAKGYVLNEKYTYIWENGGTNHLIVPEGFKTDLASVPRIVWSITGIRPDGLIRAGAVVHDFIYRNMGELPAGSHVIYKGETIVSQPLPWTRKQADMIFSRIMRECGVSKFKRRAAYWAVRTLGWMSWKKK